MSLSRTSLVSLVIIMVAIGSAACGSSVSEEVGSSPSPSNEESDTLDGSSPTAMETAVQEPSADFTEYVATEPEDLVGEWVSPLGYDLRFVSSGEFSQSIALSPGGGYYKFEGEELVFDSRSCRKWDEDADKWVFFGCVASYKVTVTKDDDSIVSLRFEVIDDPDINRSKGFVEQPWTRAED